jgi:tight adherence protein C
LAAVLLTLGGWKALRTAREWRAWRHLKHAVARSVPPTPEDELALPFWPRVIGPLAARWNARLARWMPGSHSVWTQRWGLAHLPGPAWLFPLGRWGLAVGAFAGGLLVPGFGWLRLAIAGGLSAIAYVFPGAWLTARAQQVSRAVERALPDFLDLLGVSMEAGLGFDAALRRCIPHVPGVAGAEWRRVLQDLDRGRTRLEALGGFADRTGLPDLRRFCALVAQAEQTGAGLAVVLHVQAEQAKETRLWRAREQAASVPVKILFPMVLFIFPAIFVVLIGPGLIAILHGLSHGGL